MWELVYEPALPYASYDPISLQQIYSRNISPPFLYPNELKDANGEVIPITTHEFQTRETIVTNYVINNLLSLTPTQFQAINLLTHVPFSTIVIEGVPSSGKTKIATNIFSACLHSSLNTKIHSHQHETPALQFEDEDEDTKSESNEEDTKANKEFSLQARFPKEAPAKSETEDKPTQEYQ